MLAYDTNEFLAIIYRYGMNIPEFEVPKDLKIPAVKLKEDADGLYYDWMNKCLIVLGHIRDLSVEFCPEITPKLREALDKFTQHSPDIALVDLNLEGIDGIDVIRALTTNNPSAAVALLIPENMDDPDVIVEAVTAGAKAYIKKPTSGYEIKGRLTKLLRRREEK